MNLKIRLSGLIKGEWISGVSAVLLYVFMSFDWFGNKDSGELRYFSVGRSAWEALDYISIVLLITAIVALAVVVLRLMDAVHGFPIPVNAVVASLGIVSTLLILFRILDPPNFGSFREIWGTVLIEGTVQLPIFLALGAAAGIAFGGCLSLREEGFSFADLRPRRDGGRR